MSDKGEGSAPRRRNPAATRAVLLKAARQRFGRLGYERTTLRDVAADAGVNAALIKRYFESKEGLFKAALSESPRFLDRGEGGTVEDRAGLLRALTLQLTSPNGTAAEDHPALLLLRTSGNDHVDALRATALDGLARRVLRAAGEGDGPADAEGDRLLEAQLLVALGIGVAVLRSSVRLQPLSDADAAALGPALGRVLDALLPPAPDPR
ncbi:TetR family transcriptional regulator [Streptomyces sp. NPDC023723]|uniref:TetR/AcrR family transcriptional regulator n=1 Tax=Streptomyces sp. NPDC023723 TaxID=3154323 RepID=UPI003409223B